ncbi:amidohydrolase family protein [Lichenifustis flavocetrariae]|uniref:Amidohydrolase family protein n=1 Tax=Lichenifustis flavocetrariae TaxID=2949735 RepID=A0AA42CH13_9HYPH|nr:amidohydrolase family protein [Lichenifustis flavocetrariae]MCW6507113.1 amidohydrolase family protein [Lichenifustis flavocetrariae]
MPVIDAHQHFWDPATGHYPWLKGSFDPIARPFGPADLAPELVREGIDGTVLVQTWNNLGETWDYIGVAAATPFVAGVVGWVDLTDPSIKPTLTALKASPNGRWLVGIRHLVQDEADPNWLLREDVRRGLATVAEAGLVYDLVIKPPQLPAALRTVADFPHLRFVLDHIAKPDIKAGAFAPWAELVRQFEPHRDHVWCKLSGMITEADWQNWTPQILKPYVDEVLQIFGPDRCMYGSDWPVCLVAGRYAQVIDALRKCLEHHDTTSKEQIFGRSAVEAYRLPSLYEGPL